MERSTIADWGATFMASISSALSIFLDALPRIVGFAVIVIVGWLIAALIAKGVAMLLRSVNFNDLAQRAGLSEFVSKMGMRSDSAGFLAGIAKWFVRLIALVVAFDALGLPAVSGVFREFLLWLPNLVVAMVVLVIGGLAARALSALVRGATSSSQLGNPQVLSRVASTLVWAFTLAVAVNQLGIAATLVNTLFMATVGALALALGLAFGLGARDTAGQIVRNWYARSQQNASRAREALEHAADAAHEAVEHPAGNDRRDVPAQAEERLRSARTVLSSSSPTERERT